LPKENQSVLQYYSSTIKSEEWSDLIYTWSGNACLFYFHSSNDNSPKSVSKIKVCYSNTHCNTVAQSKNTNTTTNYTTIYSTIYLFYFLSILSVLLYYTGAK